MLIDLLQEYGFSSREAKIYLTCLEFGEDVVSSIARRAGENRVTTYSILKDLSLRGISNEVIKNSKKYYSVISPEKLVKRQEEKFTKIKNALPELMAITSEYAHKPKIFYYEGSTGIIEIFKGMLDENDEIKGIVGKEKVAKSVEEYMYTEYQVKRIEKKIPIKLMYSLEKEADNEGQENKVEKYSDETKFRKTIIIPNEIFDIESSIRIYGYNKIAVIMHSQKELSGLIIESNNLYKSFSSIFETIWSVYQNIQ